MTSTTQQTKQPSKKQAGKHFGPAMRSVTIPEHTCVMKELDSNDTNPLALDSSQVARFVTRAIKRAGRDRLALHVHGFYLQVDPLVLLFGGQLEGVNRTACVPLKDGAEISGDDLITFPESRVREMMVPDAMPLDAAVKHALASARVWALEHPQNRLGSFVRLHIIPDPSSPSGAKSVLRIEQLVSVED